MLETPRWLRDLERSLGWLAVPNIASFLVGLQFIGLVLAYADPSWPWRLALIPELVIQGELWRLVTFLAVPVSRSPFWILFVLWFLYFIVENIEAAWGEFKTTFYILISILLTIGFSLLFMVPIAYVGDLHSTLFLAAAALNPEFQILLFFVIPVKIKWLAWLTGAFILWRFVTGPWVDKLYLVAIYSNYLIFFAPYHYTQIKQIHRRWKFKREIR